MKKLFTTILLLMIVLVVNAQEQKITRNLIITTDQFTLPSVNVLIKSTTQTTITDFDSTTTTTTIYNTSNYKK